MRHTVAVCVALTVELVSTAGGSRAARPDPTLDIMLRPVRNGGAEVTSIEVRAVLDEAESDNAFSVRAAITYAGVTGIADRIEALEVADKSGAVPLTIDDDPVNPGGFPYFRHWRAGRAVESPIVLTYRSLPQSTPPSSGPVFAFRAHGAGISAAGSGFLALPDIKSASTRVHWDLSELTPGSIAASSWGEGDLALSGDPNDLTQGYFMAGPLGRFSPPEAHETFTGYWLGQPPFDPATEMAWAYRSLAYQRTFYRDTSDAPYRVFVRALPGATRTLGGTALQRSFMLSVPVGAADPAATAPRETLAHEMGHMFVGQIAGEHAGPWFNEGLNVYYTRLLLLRSGLEPVSAYEGSINKTAHDYYVNPYRNESAEALDRLGFSAGIGSGGAQNVPYTRGSLYFALVDSKIRAASGGSRKLDDVILAMLERRRSGQTFDADALIAAFEKAYGPSARTDFESVILRGKTIVPPSDAFGPCFERKATMYTVDGRPIDGFQWVRMTSVPDRACRTW